ncbi:MAG TPA: ComEA family DNA-binding protein [Gaiellaceae bacterium]|jgi:competence protein ComEA
MGSFPLTVPQRRALAGALVALVLIVVAWRHMAHHRAAPQLAVAPLTVSSVSDSSSTAALAAHELIVDVAGAVQRPGVYKLPQGARVQAAVAQAGGLTSHADSAAVNLAAPLVDGEQVVVATRGAGGIGATAGSSAGPVSLSAATAEQLDTLPGIGPVTAQKIVDYRQQHGPFTSLDGLDAIPGIGAARIQELQGLAVP